MKDPADLLQQIPSSEIDKQLLLLNIKDRIINGWKTETGTKKHGLFAQQREILLDPCHFKTGLCSRASGKTSMAARALILALIDATEGEHVIYGAKTLEHAHNLIWTDIRSLTNELRLEKHLGWIVGADNIKTPAGARLMLIGLDSRDNADKLRGFNMPLVIFDEAQSYEDTLLYAIDECVRPRLISGKMDQGTIILLGTPGYALSGPWYEVTEQSKDRGWKNFHWTMLDNPHVNGRQIMDDVLLSKGITEDDPLFQREYLGRWKADDSKLVHPHFKKVALPAGWNLNDSSWNQDNLTATVGIDYGFSPDPSAWVVLAQKHGEQTIYVVHAEKEPRTSDDKYAAITRDVYDQYVPARMVGDVGGGGKSAIETFNEKFGDDLGIYVEVAEKTNKRAAIDALNVLLRSGRLVIPLCQEELSPRSGANDARSLAEPRVA